MSTGERDCRHLCCDERDNPFHDHYLPPEQCPHCARHAAIDQDEDGDEANDA